MKLILTGGHLSPLLCVLEALPKDFRVMILGRRKALEGDASESLEYKAIQKLKIPFASIVSGRLQRRFTRHTVFSLLKFPVGFFQSILILKRFRSKAILSFGGYISLPVVFAGFILRIPIVIHEQTLEAGLSNKIAGIFAKKICISWNSSRKFFPKSKTVLTGNPIRKFKDQSSKIKVDQNYPLIYITGGSLGSHAINVLVEGCIEKLLLDFNVFHQTGDAEKYDDFKRLEKLKESFNSEIKEKYELIKFVSPEMVGSILEKADFVVSRSGINTVTELIYFGKPSLLVPLPFSQNNEQIKNAQMIVQIGLGEILNQEKINSQDLYLKIKSMFENIEKYKKAGETSKKMITDNAAEKIAEIVRDKMYA